MVYILLLKALENLEFAYHDEVSLRNSVQRLAKMLSSPLRLRNDLRFHNSGISSILRDNPAMGAVIGGKED